MFRGNLLTPSKYVVTASTSIILSIPIMIRLDFVIFAGLVFAFLDHTLYSKLQGMRPQLLRAAYVTLPIMAMPISYVSLREFSANMLEKFTNKKRDSNWTYSIAALGPTGIVMGVASKSATDKSFLTISRITEYTVNID